MPTSELRVARDPALGLVVRIFVGALADRCAVPDRVRDDLRLAASELFSGAVEAGGDEAVVFRVSSDDAEVILRADGIGPLREPRTADGELWGGRVALIRALFPTAEVGSAVSIRVPAGT